MQQGDYEYTFDIKNCSLWGNRVNATYTYTKSLTEKQALTSVDKFMQDTFLKDKVFYQLGKPIILSRNNYGVISPMMKEGMAYREQNTDVFSGIEVDTGDVQEVSPEYTSFSIMYPYVINGQDVYEQYGTRAGITLEVSSE